MTRTFLYEDLLCETCYLAPLAKFHLFNFCGTRVRKDWYSHWAGRGTCGEITACIPLSFLGCVRTELHVIASPAL